MIKYLTINKSKINDIKLQTIYETSSNSIKEAIEIFLELCDLYGISKQDINFNDMVVLKMDIQQDNIKVLKASELSKYLLLL